MTTRILGLMVLLVMTCAACGETIRGNNEITSRSREVDTFHELSTSGFFEIELAEGSPRVEVETDDNLHEHIVTEVKNGVLHVHTNNKHLIAEKLKITVFYEQLSAVNVSGAAEITSRESIQGGSFSLDISGAGEANLGMNVEHLEVEISGGGDLKLGGSAETVNFEISGAGQIEALPLHAREADIEVNGAGEIGITVEEKLTVDIAGAGEVKYAGNPEVIQNITGAGELKQLEDEQ